MNLNSREGRTVCTSSAFRPQAAPVIPVNPLKQAMPLLAAQERVRDGGYRHSDADGDKIDEKKASDAWRGP
ncbi:MAG: hypothetical protein MUC71_05065 [Steroidobacteraceae bacterium]|jgi:hypothetical protein|nr:hypothetical protein [Steroidobacteraceae bacterium]